jgi:hypothetical protein
MRGPLGGATNVKSHHYKEWCSLSHLANPTQSHPTEITRLFFGQPLRRRVVHRTKYAAHHECASAHIAIERASLTDKTWEKIAEIAMSNGAQKSDHWI